MTKNTSAAPEMAIRYLRPSVERNRPSMSFMTSLNVASMTGGIHATTLAVKICKGRRATASMKRAKYKGLYPCGI